MKKEKKEKKEAISDSEEKPQIDFPKEIESLGIGETSFIKRPKREKIFKIRPEDIPIEEILGIKKEEKDLTQEDQEDQEEESPPQVLEQTIQDEYPLELTSGDSYAGPKDIISYDKTSSDGGTYSATGQSQTSSDTYAGSGGSGGTYEGTNQRDQGGGYEQSLQPISAPKERVGEIRDTSSSALESKFIKMSKGKGGFQPQQDKGY